MPQSVTAYIRSQGACAAVINAIVNPALAWAINRKMGYVPLSDIASDAALTSVVLSLLVALFVTAGVRRDFKAGRVNAANGEACAGRLLLRLPGRAWALGSVLGLGAALVFIPPALALFRLLGISGLSLPRFALCKAVYAGVLGFAVTRWVILRQAPRIPRAVTPHEEGHG